MLPGMATATARAAARSEAQAALARDIDVLARTLWGEARGEGEEGMQAVAAVICNRARQPGWWGRGIAGICQRARQFSCWNADDPNRAALLAVDASDPAFATALRLARLAVAGALPDPTHGATHYHSLSVRPAWAAGQQPCARIGGHLFYRAIA